MDIARFKSIVARLEQQSAAAPRAYQARVALLALTALAARVTPPTWNADTRSRLLPVTVTLEPMTMALAETDVTADTTAGTGAGLVVVVATTVPVPPPPPPPPQADRPSMAINAISKWFFMAGIRFRAARQQEKW